MALNFYEAIDTKWFRTQMTGRGINGAWLVRNGWLPQRQVNRINHELPVRPEVLTDLNELFAFLPFGVAIDTSLPAPAKDWAALEKAVRRGKDLSLVIEGLRAS